MSGAPMMSGFEGFLMLLAILAAFASLVVPFILLTMVAKVLRQHDEAEQRDSAQFKYLQENLRGQQRLLKQLLGHETPDRPQPPPVPATQAATPFKAAEAATPHDEPIIASVIVPTPSGPMPPVAQATVPSPARQARPAP